MREYGKLGVACGLVGLKSERAPIMYVMSSQVCYARRFGTVAPHRRRTAHQRTGALQGIFPAELFMEPTPRAVLVTGASSGIGRAAAALLASRGFRVFAGTRTESDAGQSPGLPAGVEPVLLDVTRPAHVERVID